MDWDVRRQRGRETASVFKFRNPFSIRSVVNGKDAWTHLLSGFCSGTMSGQLNRPGTWTPWRLTRQGVRCANARLEWATLNIEPTIACHNKQRDCLCFWLRQRQRRPFFSSSLALVLHDNMATQLRMQPSFCRDDGTYVAFPFIDHISLTGNTMDIAFTEFSVPRFSTWGR